MFNNIGGKMKSVARAACVLGIIISIIGGLAVGAAFEETSKIVDKEGLGIFLGFVIAAAGCLISWLMSMLLYGFGQLVENSDTLVWEVRKKDINAAQENPIQSTADDVSVDAKEEPHELRCNVCGCIVSGNFCPVCGAGARRYM